VNPFPQPYATLLGDNPSLQASLSTAIAEALINFPSLDNPFRTAMSFVAIDEWSRPADFRHAGIRYGDSFYTASLAKVGALYAAFELLRSVNALARQVTAPQALFARLHADFDPVIDAAVPSIALEPGLTRAMRLPKYEQIFLASPAAGGLACSFSAGFLDNIRKMIIKGSNDAAAGCIRLLGYSWINGSLHAGGFFFPPAQTGIWLAGTYASVLPVVRIPSVNDGLVAQASTCFDMANLYAHMYRGTLVDESSSKDMRALLAVSASTGDDPSFLDFTRRPFPPRNFGVTHSKIGSGPLKTGRIVDSEGVIVEHSDTGRKYLTVFHNSFDDDDSLTALGYIVDRTIELDLAGP
jgi:hypothetical protein